MDAQTQSQNQEPMEGTSNPPNGGQVLDIANPEANDAATVSQTAAPNIPPTPAPTPVTATAPQGVNSSPVQGNTSNGPGQQPGKPSDLSKTPGPQQPNGIPAPQGPPPAVKKASMFHDIAEALAGGPRYTYSVDSMGNMQKKQVPISNGHLALAIAMEALTGAAAGFGVQNGPGNLGRAASAGFAAGAKQSQQITQNAKDQATQDYARRVQTTELNMRMYNNARSIGKMDADAADAYIGQYKDLVDKIQSEFPGYIKAIASYKDLAKYNVTADTAIPYKRVPRLDSEGKQVEINGKPQWDMDYLILDPSFKTTGMLSPEDTKRLSAWGQPGMDNQNITDAPLNARLALNKKSMATQLGVAEQMFSNFFDTVDEATGVNHQISADVTKPGTLTSPEVKNTKIQGMVDNVAEKYAPSIKTLITPDNFQALLRGLVSQESGGDPNAISATGATGVGQFTKTTAKQYGLIDADGNDNRTDPAKNTDATAHYFSDLLKQYQGDPKKALAAYYSGPGAIGPNGAIQDTKDHSAADTQKYVDSVAGRVGLLQAPDVATDKKHPLPTDFAKEHATFASDVEKFMGAYNSLPPGSEGQVGAALAHLRQSGQGDAANNIAAYLQQGGADAIKTHDDYVTTQAEQRKSDVQTKAIEARAAAKNANDEAAHAKKQAMLDTLETANVPQDALKMDPKDVYKSLQAQGVTLPAEAIRDAMAIARYDAPINVASNKLWFKDQSLTQQDMLNVVRQFNPTYNVDNYKDLHSFTSANSKPAQTFQAAAAVSNHLNMLTELAHAIKSGAGQYPLINKLENELNYHTGGSDYSRLAALTGAVNDEMGKVLSGGFAPQKGQVEAIMKNMTPENSEKQIDDLARLYTGVMHGKVAPYDEQYNQMSGAADKHLANIPSSFTTLSQKYGYETPWSQRQQAQGTQQMLPGQLTPQEVPVYGNNGQVLGFTVPGAKGYRALQTQ